MLAFVLQHELGCIYRYFHDLLIQLALNYGAIYVTFMTSVQGESCNRLFVSHWRFFRDAA
jgi:hypothetical protein